VKLTAYLNGLRVGWFEQLRTGAVVLEYDPTWQQGGGRRELSLSLPKSRRRHTGNDAAEFGDRLIDAAADRSPILLTQLDRM
jgi:serine/threonine-protein kinase HipA